MDSNRVAFFNLITKKGLDYNLMYRIITCLTNYYDVWPPIFKVLVDIIIGEGRSREREKEKIKIFNLSIYVVYLR